MSVYAIVPAPSWWTGKTVDVIGTNVRYASRHQVVYCEANGLTEVPKGYVVHHKDEDVRNDVPSNLELKQRGRHSSEHLQGNTNAVGNKSRLGQLHFAETKQKMREAALRRYRKESAI